MKQNEMLDQIDVVRGNSEVPNGTLVPQAQVLLWMHSEDIEVLGSVYAFLCDERHSQRIQPPIDLSDLQSFLMRYFERCIREDPHGEWASSSYEAGWDLANWFAGFWRDRKVPRKTVRELKEWLAKLYKEGDETLRICLINATLEHLFEDREISKYFADWKEDPILAKAYREAMVWSQKGGSSPLGKPK